MKVIDDAIKKGACNKIVNVKSEEELVKLFFSPQGREFCIEHNFPSLEWFSERDFEKYNIFVNKENVIAKNKNIALINSHGELEFTEGYHVVILMHGATANIRKSWVACVTVEGEGATRLDN